jgi:hypothetical protein
MEVGMLRKIGWILLTGISLLFAAPSEVSLKGTVKKADKTAISGANVYLASDTATKVISDADGKFELEIVKTRKPYGINVQRSIDISGQGASLGFSINTAVSSGLITLFSGNGRIVKNIPLQNLSAGSHSIPLVGISNGFYILQITLGDQTVRRRVITAGSEVFVSDYETRKGETRSEGRLAKITDAVDTLIAAKEGFVTKKTPIDVYVKENIEIIMEKEAAFECVLPDLPATSALKANQKLPDPFTFWDGTKVTKKSQWPCRRKEILAMAYKYMYGQMPPFEAPDVEVDGTVAGNGVTAKVTYKGKSATLNFSTSGSGDILLISMGGGLGPGSGYPHRTFNVNNNLVNSWKNTCNTLFGMSPCGEIAIGWGCNILCRAIADDPDGGIDTNKIMTTGCSNTAKAAFLAAVFCEGIDLAVVVESGGFGDASFRVAEYLYKGPGTWNCSDPPQGLWSPDYGDQWLAAPYMDPNVASWVIGNNSGNVYKLPFDTHLLIACVAPRHICILTNGNGPKSWCHLNGTGSAVAGWAAKPVFKALGVSENLAVNIPKAYTHCTEAQQTHGSLVEEFFKRVFKGDKNAKTDVVNIPKDQVQLDPAKWKETWVDWDMDVTLE